jgi:hypothetical protein
MQMLFHLYDHGYSHTDPLIYMWEIYDENQKLTGRYVGKAKNGAKRPLKRYQKNVQRLLNQQPYHIKGRDYRRVHYALAHATKQGHTIHLHFLCQATIHSINQLEREYIDQHQSCGAESWQLNDC